MKDAGWAEHLAGKAYKKIDPDNPFYRPEYFENAKNAAASLGGMFKTGQDANHYVNILFPKVDKN